MDIFQACFNASPNVLAVLQADDSGQTYRYRHVNTRFFSELGLNPQQVLGKTPYDLLPAAQAVLLVQALMRCRSTGQPQFIEHTFTTLSGERSWEVHINDIALPGRQSNLLLTARDVSWRQNQVLQLQTISRFLPGFVYQIVFDPKTGGWRFTFISDSVTERFGLSVASILGNPDTLLNLIHPDDRQKVLDESLDALRAMRPWHSVFRMVHPDGRVLWAESRDLPQLQPDGTVVCTGYNNGITENRRLEAEITHLARFDTVTGLVNRREFIEQLEMLLRKVERSSHQFALLFLDLDHFKPVNDTHGHAVGDILLEQVGHRLRSTLRAKDTVARLGGDEFTVLLSDTGSADVAMQLADKVCAAIAQPFDLEGVCVQVSVSVGVALYPQHGLRVQALMLAADMAMYEAKAQGRGKAVLASAGLSFSRPATP
jgi:diguanylate cyclase (GGDEF)-like protein/PAS domain S-box-containing protein